MVKPQNLPYLAHWQSRCGHSSALQFGRPEANQRLKLPAVSLRKPAITIHWNRCTGNRSHDALEFAITLPRNHDHHGLERAPLVAPSSERSMKEITCTLSIK